MYVILFIKDYYYNIKYITIIYEVFDLKKIMIVILISNSNGIIIRFAYFLGTGKSNGNDQQI